MNENNFNGMQNMNPQPVTPVAPVQPVTPVAPVQPVVTPVTPSVPVVSNKTSSQNEVMKWVGFGSGIAVALSAFLPYASAYSVSVSIWDNGKLSAIILALFGVIAALTYFFGKAKRFSMQKANPLMQAIPS